MNKTIQILAIKIGSYQIKIELISLAILLIGIMLRDSETGMQLIIISLSALSLLYFLMAFRIEDLNNRFLSIINKIIYWAFSIGIIGILFSINHYPNAEQMLRIGLSSIAFGLIGLIILKFRYKSDKKNIDADLIRTFIIALTLAGLMLFGNLSDLKQINSEQSIEKQEINGQ